MKYTAPPLIRFCQWIGLSPDRVLYLVSDVVCLVLSAALAVLLRLLMGEYEIWPYAFSSMLLMFLLSPIVGAMLGIYTTNLMQPPHNQLSILVFYVTITYAVIFMVFFFMQTGLFHSRLTLFMGWLFACIAVPVGRFVVAARFCRYPWWGLPLIFLDRSSTGKKLWHYLRMHPEKGFRPVAFLDVPAFSMTDDIRASLQETVRQYPGAVVMLADAPGQITSEYIDFLNTIFSRILIMPVAQEEQGARKFLLTPYVLHTTTGFYLQQRLHDKRRIAIKRAIDLLLCTIGLWLVLPLTLVLAVAIRLDSKGSIFFVQDRIGQGGRKIRVHKFRTMVQNADAKLAKCLAEDPELRAEWERDQKLRNDPRITRVGRFLRHTSLDELPQIFDVMLGTMSLVGPRPIVESERKKYGSVFNAYIRVRPGITGLWQISGRNDTTYAERVDYDFFYVSNWSVWLDIWILARTIPVVLFGKGAY